MLLITWVLLRVLFSSGGSGLVAGLEEKEVEREEAYRVTTDRSIDRVLK